MAPRIPRRSLIGATGLGWLADVMSPARRRLEGRIVGASHERGHWLRDGAPASKGGARESSCDVLVVGGGIAGLSAAWRLAPLGLDVVVAELEDFVGGTSARGEDGVLPYPWGAHYLAAPNPEARAALRLLADMGVVTGFDAAARPRFDPKVLCHSPQERLFYDGVWHEGLSPVDVLTDAEEEELARFHEIEEALTRREGRDGRPAFTIPLGLSSRDPELLALDRMSFAEWLDRERFVTPFVRWYVAYATLDDFGALPEETSAWAALHYFAARKLKTPELAGSHFLVWPEGNGRLVRELRARAKARIEPGLVALEVDDEGSRGATVLLRAARDGALARVRARAVVLAVPAFVARRLLPEAATRLPTRAASPWLVANLHARRPIEPNRAWDSVLFGAKGLGYVDASHQGLVPREQTVLTYYRAFGGPDVAGARRELVKASWHTLADAVLADLAPAHPTLVDDLDRLDVMVWGHAMPRPRPGFLASALEPTALVGERVAWAHSDQAGIALFEEAQARGVAAAEALAAALGLAAGETWL